MFRVPRLLVLPVVLVAVSGPPSPAADHRKVVEACDGVDDPGDDDLYVDDGCDSLCDAPSPRAAVPVSHDVTTGARGCWTGRVVALLWGENTGAVRLGTFHQDASTVVPPVLLDTEASPVCVEPMPDHLMALYTEEAGEEARSLCLERRVEATLEAGGRTCHAIEHLHGASWTWTTGDDGILLVETEFTDMIGATWHYLYIERTSGAWFDPDDLVEVDNGRDADAATRRTKPMLQTWYDVGITWVHDPITDSCHVVFQRFDDRGNPRGEQIQLTPSVGCWTPFHPRITWRVDEWGVLYGGPGGIASLARISPDDRVLETVEIGHGVPVGIAWTGQEYGMLLLDGDDYVLYRYDPFAGTVTGPVRMDGGPREADLAWTGGEYEVATVADERAVLRRVACCDDADADGFDECRDVEDREAGAHPGAPELCNGLDDDEDGSLDEGCPRDCPAPYPRAGEIRVTEDPASSRTTYGRSLAWRGDRWHVGWYDAPGGARRGAWYVTLDADGNPLEDPKSLTEWDHEDDVVCLDARADRAALWSLEPDGDGTVQLALDRHGGPFGEPPLFVDPGRGFRVDDAAWSGNAHAVLVEREGEDRIELYLLRYDLDGHRLHPAFPVTGEAARPVGGAAEATVAWSGDGYGVAWTDRRGIEPAIWFRPLSAWGYPVGPEVKVATEVGAPDHEEREPSLASRGDGYAIAWADLRSGTWRIYFALLDREGHLLEDPGEVPVSDGTREARHPVVAWNGEEFAVAWEEWPHPWESEIHVARVLADGTVTGDEAVLATAPGPSTRLDLAWNGEEWAVAWTDQRDDNDEVYFAPLACCRQAAPPGPVTGLTFDPEDEEKRTLSWDPEPTAAAYDLVRGDLDVLRESGGDFSAAVEECLADDLATTSFRQEELPEGNAFYLVRGENCRGHGTWDSGGPGQQGRRDPEIAASPGACP